MCLTLPGEWWTNLHTLNIHGITGNSKNTDIGDVTSDVIVVLIYTIIIKMVKCALMLRRGEVKMCNSQRVSNENHEKACCLF